MCDQAGAVYQRGRPTVVVCIVCGGVCEGGPLPGCSHRVMSNVASRYVWLFGKLCFQSDGYRTVFCV